MSVDRLICGSPSKEKPIKLLSGMLNRICLIALLVLGLTIQSPAYGSSDNDEHIREIVQNMLKEKDQKIEQLESRIRQLEQERGASAVAAAPNPTTQTTAPAQKIAKPDPVKVAVVSKVEPTSNGKLPESDKIEQGRGATVANPTNQSPAPAQKTVKPEPVKTLRGRRSAGHLFSRCRRSGSLAG